MSIKPAKLTLPGLTRVFLRTRLFKKLDDLRQFPVVWIAAPGGAGKTTLVASYLRAKNITPLWYQIDQGDSDIASFFYYLGEGLKQLSRSRKRGLPLLTSDNQFGLPVFSRNFFRSLFEKMKAPSILVLDNFEWVNDDVVFNQILQQGLEEIPPGCQVIVTGRASPPAQYAGMLAKKQLVKIGWEELQLTEKESAGVISQLHAGDVCSNEMADLLHKTAQGWVSGLVLLNQFCSSNEPPDMSQMVSDKTDDGYAQQAFFDYFTHEIFSRLPEKTQIFLLKITWLCPVRVSAARKLSGVHAAKNILADLERRQIFTVRRGVFKPVYTFHPLFDDFLKEKAQAHFSRQELDALKNRAAQLLVDEKEIEEAARLFVQTQNWSALEQIIHAHAAMLCEQGRFQVLRNWIDQLPLSQQNVWTTYWRGSINVMFEPLVAKVYFEKSYYLFKAANDARGTYLSWLGVMDSLFYAHDSCADVPKWIDELELVRKKHARYPSLEIKGRVTFTAFIIQLMGCPQRDSFDVWRQKAERMQRFIPNASIRCLTGSQLAMYYTFYGQITKLKVLAKSLIGPAGSDKVMPIARILAYWVEINRGWMSGETVETESVINAALKVSKDSGVYVTQLWLLSAIVMHYLARQNISAAEKFLDQLQQFVHQTHRGEHIHYHYLAGWLACLKGDLELAYEHSRTACQNIVELHTPYLELISHCAYSFVLIEMTRFDEARQQIEKNRQLAADLKSDSMGVFYLGMLEAWMACKQQQPERALPHLRSAFAYARKVELIGMPWHVPAMLAPLCVLALENNIERSYVRTFIRKNALAMPTGALHLPDWPVPVRVYTLGRFSLLVNDMAVVRRNNAYNKPCELLCALIAFGGRDVNDSRLEEALWPGAEGDAAHRALITNLQRLRRLLGIAEAVQYSDGKLTLDTRYCRVDAWAFERGLKTDNPVQLAQTLSFYQGAFLHSEGDSLWLLPMRERLRRKYLQQLEKLTESLADNDQWQEAIVWYHRGLLVDNLHEACYRGLIRAHQKLGETGEAIRVYRECQQKLQAELGVAPSLQTTALFESLSD